MKAIRNIRFLIVVILSILYCGVRAGQAHAASSTYTYYRAVSVTSTAGVASGTFSNFPMLFSGTYPWLASASLGGTLQNANGYDHAYSTSTTCTSFLNYQNVSYTSSTGAVTDWIQVPTMAAGSVIYICYDNSTIATSQATTTAVWSAESLNGYWPLDEGSGTTAADLSGLNSVPTWSGTQASPSTTYYAKGQIGFAGYLNGSNDVATFTASNTAFQFWTSTSFTISAWFNASTTAAATNTPSLFGVMSGSNGSRYGLDYTGPSDGVASSSITLFARDDAGNSKQFYAPANAIAQNTWYHVAMVVNRPSTTMSLYINGIFSTSTSISALTGNLSPNGSGTIGGVVSGPQPSLGGLVDDIRLYSRTLTSQEILTNYNNQNSPSTFYAVGSQNNLPDTTAPTVPQNLAAQFTGTNQVNLSWASSTDNVAVTGYDVYRNGVKIATSSGASYADTSVSENNSYAYFVDAYDAAGNVSATSTTATAQASTYTYYRAVSVTSTAGVASGTFSNFPMLFSGTYPWLASASLGGTLQNANGYDHAYSTSTTCTSFLNYQNVSYTSSTGAVTDWIQVPTMAAGSVIYICYDNSTIATSQATTTAVWSAESLNGYWPLDEGSGTTAADLSGLNSVPTWSGTQASPSTTYYAKGQIGFAGYLNGSNDVATFTASNTAFQFWTSTSFTISAWFNASTTAAATNTPSLFGVMSGSNGSRYGLDYTGPSDGVASSSITLFARDDAGNSKQFYAPANAIAQNTWYHVAMVVNRPSTTMSLYINGIFSTSTSISALTGNLSPNGSGTIGGVVSGPQPSLGGLVDDIRLYSRTLTSQEILTNYNNQNSPSTFYAVGSQNNLPDTTAPTVSMVSPASGTTVSSVVTLTASSTDNVAVQGVQFQIDGANLGSKITATSGPTLYSTTWNTASSSDGTHIISAIAYDTSNNSSTATSSVIVTPLVISNLTISQITTSSVQITWTTNEAATTQVEYGSTSSYGSSTSATDLGGVFSHTVTLTNLFPDTTYHYAAESVDLSSNPDISGDMNFKTASALQTYYLQDFDSSCGQPGHNCRAAFQEAFAAIAAAGGGTLQLLPGTFQVDFPEVPQNVSSGGTLASSSLIVVPPNTLIQGSVSALGTYQSMIQWSISSIPPFVFNNSSNSSMRDLHWQFTGTAPTLFPYGDIALLKALGYGPTSTSSNQMSGGNYEMFSAVYIFNSDNCSFDHLLFDSATQNNNNIFGFAINLKGKGVVVASGTGGLDELASGNSITNIQLADYDMGFLVSGQNNFLIQNIAGDWRGSDTAISPGHIIYMTSQSLFHGSQNSPTSSTNVIIKNITEGSDVLSMANALGTMAIKFIKGGQISNVASYHPEGLIQTITSDQNINFSNMAWSSSYLLCENVPANCGTPVINFFGSSTPPAYNIAFQNINIQSTGDAVAVELENDNVSADGMYITTPAIYLPSQVAATGVLTTKYTSSGTITNYAFTPYMASYNASSSYNLPFEGWDTSYNVSANVLINWPSGISLPTSGYIVTSQFQDPSSSVENDVLNQTILQNTVPPSAPTGLAVTATTGSTVSLQWNPSADALGIAGYLVSRQGTVIGITTSTSYEDMNGLAASTTYGYTVAAYDMAGNNAVQSGSVNATTGAASTMVPTVQIVNPFSGTDASGTITVSAIAADETGITKVELYVDGTLVGTDAGSPYSFSLNTASLTNGTHTLLAKAYDASGNTNLSDSVSIILANASVSVPTGGTSSGGGGGGGYYTPVTTPSASTSSLITELASLEAELQALEIEARGGVMPSSTTPAATTSPNVPIAPAASCISIPIAPAALQVTSYPFTRNLAYGNRGADVAGLQAFLINQNTGPAAGNLALVGPTGFFGSRTLAALKEFQASACIWATGYFGTITRGWLAR